MKKHLLILVSLWIIVILLGITIFLILFGYLAHYFYLKALRTAQPALHQSFNNALTFAIFLIRKYWIFFYQRRIIVILVVLLSFPFVRRCVRQGVLHKVQDRPILKKLCQWLPWIRALILTWLIIHFMLYDVAKKVGQQFAKENLKQRQKVIE